MTAEISQGTWYPVKQKNGFYYVAAVSRVKNSPFREIIDVVSGAQNPHDAVLCANAPAMYECLSTCANILSAYTESNEELTNLHRYVTDILTRIDVLREDVPF